MRVLLACEESQAVCIEFRKRGHEAFSCDTQECSGGHPEWHIQDDVLKHLNDGWDLMIAFPPCTHLSAAGAPLWKTKAEDGRQQEAYDFFVKMYDAPISKVCVENPTGYMNTHFRKPDQIINPYQFGEPYKKRTCLWLKNLPPLNSTQIVEPLYHFTSNSYRGGKLKDGTRRISKLPVKNPWDGSKQRSKTFRGIAKAMATQWSEDLTKESL